MIKTEHHDPQKIVILGGGPCGLGAAFRLNELGLNTFDVYEKEAHWGGLSASFTDSAGFTWDIGGHVLFSHYTYFDDLMDTLFDGNAGWIQHERESWIYMQDRFIPYPMQNNIHRLPQEVFWECLKGIIAINTTPQKPVTHFGDWVDAYFGEGLATYFLRPYNYKVWAYPLTMLDYSWVGERVSPVDLTRVLENHVFDKDDISWGPNATFRFPAHGGTGAIWEKIATTLPPERMHLSHAIERIDINTRQVFFSNGTKTGYDILLNTMPLPLFVRLCGLTDPPFATGDDLLHSTSHIIGLALKGHPPDHLVSKCWMYFPEDNCPFYRVTVFSNYSPNNVPDITQSWSLMCEVSESPLKKVDSETVVTDVIQGALNTNLIPDRTVIDHTWYFRAPHGYPTPSLNRNAALFPALKALEGHNIYSRGRFGGWRYEVGNMDHTFMQGVEFANRMVCTSEELTLWYPNIVNQPHPSGEKH